MKSKGFGDTIAKITKYTGIKWFVSFLYKKIKKDCGCSSRQESLNRVFPYNK